MNKLRTLLSVLLVSVLAACGGGGSEGDDSSPTPPAQVDDRESSALTTSVPAPTYAAGTGELAIYRLLEGVREGADAGLFTQSSALDKAAADHLSYLQQNYPATTHEQDPAKPGFTAAMPWDRAAAHGYYGTVGEVFATTSSASAEECVRTLLATVYHQELLMYGMRDIGIAFGPVSPNGVMHSCIINLGVRDGQELQLVDAGVVKAYPFDGQVIIDPEFAPAAEIPNPMPDVGTQMVGHPILASMSAYEAEGPYAVQTFTLTDSSGTPLEARIIGNGVGGIAQADPQEHMLEGDVYLVPMAPLVAGQTYTVSFVGTADGVRFAKDWSFSVN